MTILWVLLASIMLAAEIVGQSANNDSVVAEVPNPSVTVPLPVIEKNSSAIASETTTVNSITEALNSTILDAATTTVLPELASTPAVLPTTVEQAHHEEHVAVEEQTVTPTPTTTAATTKKPAPLVIPSGSSSLSAHNEGHVQSIKTSGSTTPRAPPPTPITPAPGVGIGDILKIPGINLPNLDRENAIINAVEKLG